MQKAVKANVMLGGIAAVVAAASTFVLIRVIPRAEFATYAAAMAASSIGVVLVEGGLTLGLARYLPEAQRRGCSLDLYHCAWRRRIWSALLGVVLLCLWGWSGLSQHKLLDERLGVQAWGFVALLLVGDLCQMLPFSGLQALFEFRSSLSIRALFALLRFGSVWAAWAWTQDIRWVLASHAACSGLEGGAYHLLLRARLAASTRCEEMMLRKTVRFGWYSIAEKGAQAAGGINSAFIVLGYLLPVEALGAIAVGKELAQKFLALAVLPLNGVTNSVLNWNAGKKELPESASKLFSLQAALFAAVGVGILYTMGWVVNLAGVGLSEASGRFLCIILGGLLGEYALRFDLLYRFRSGLMRSAVVYAYAAAAAGLAGLICGTYWSGVGGIVGYYLCRLGMLAVAFLPNMAARYRVEQMRIAMALLLTLLVCAGLRGWDCPSWQQAAAVACCTACGAWYAIGNIDWLRVCLDRRVQRATPAEGNLPQLD